MKELGTYQNGNYTTTIYEDGTKVWETEEEDFIPEFAESIDLKITNSCDMDCPMCFVAGTKILMSDHTYKNIEDVKVGDTIIAFEESPKKHGYKRKIVTTTVIKTFVHVEEELIKVTTDSGNSIISTPNHPFLSEGTGAKHSRLYNKIENIRIGSYLFEYGFPLEDIDWNSNSYKLGYMIGAWVGDGTVKHYIDKNGYDAYNSRFVTLDEEINDRVYEFTKYFITDVYKEPFKIANHDIPNNSVRSNKKSVYESLTKFCNDNISKNTNKEYACGFLGGFYDSEGTLGFERSTIRISNVNYNYIAEVERCLDILNIEYIEEFIGRKAQNMQDIYNVRVRGSYSATRFLWYTNPVCERKSLNTYLLNMEQYYKHNIISKEQILDKQYVYNLATESHTYIANNFLVHNCHEQSTPYGEQADILNEKFIDTLHPYQELAIGGGNVLTHPDLVPFLVKLKDLKVIPNITLNQYHFETNQSTIKYLVENKLIYGIGVSIRYPSCPVHESTIDMIKQYDNTVIHIINGMLFDDMIKSLYDKDLKILILGYKKFGRGEDFYNRKDYDDTPVGTYIDENIQLVKRNLKEIIKHFKVVSFDNLAIEQLDVQNILSPSEWDEFYFGDDGSHTFYIDAVERKFATSSTTPKNCRYDLMDSVDDMFHAVRN